MGPYEGVIGRPKVEKIDANGNVTASVLGPLSSGITPGVPEAATIIEGTSKTGRTCTVDVTLDDWVNFPTQYRQIVNGVEGGWGPVPYNGLYEAQELSIPITGMNPATGNTVQLEFSNGSGSAVSNEITVTTPSTWRVKSKLVDPEGDPIVGAPVIINDVVLTTDEDGEFETEVPDGDYKIEPPAYGASYGVKDVHTWS